MKVIDVYQEAWKKRDPDLITTIFTDNAVYHEYVLAKPIRGKTGIWHYWQSRVAGGQDNIEFRLINVYIDGNTAIAEWEAFFDAIHSRARKHMKEVAILEFEGDKIKSLREYWSAETVRRLKKPKHRPAGI
ncbi:MAG TPA: nuclear transport factor 2 family protein [Candidatus Angelobacter sp.]|nr:nuclear transport factor 2 family protein [Candidatus Angelobacter sp.]